MHRALSLAVALVVGATVLAGPAAALDQWTTPQRLPAGQAAMVAVASSGSGDIFTTYSANGILEVSRRPGGRWVRGRDPVGGGGRGVVVDDDGNVTVAYPTDGYCPWEQGDETGDPPDPFRIEAKFRPYRSENWRVFRLPGQWDGCNQSEPVLDVDDRGTVTAVWSGDGRLYATQRRLGHRWSQPVVIGRGSGTTFDLVATNQKVTAMWATGDTIRSSASTTFGRWGKGRTVAKLPDGDYRSADHLSLTDTGRGSLLAAWSDSVVRDREWHHRVRFAAMDRQGHWRTPRTVDQISAEPVWVHAVVVAAQGSRAVLAWHKMQRHDEEGGPLRVRTRTAGKWSSAKLLDRHADQFGPNGLAATESGTALVWAGGDAGNHFPLASTRRWSGEWGPAQLLSSQDPPEATAYTPWVVAYKPDIFTAAFTRDRLTWATDLRVGAAH